MTSSHHKGRGGGNKRDLRQIESGESRSLQPLSSSLSDNEGWSVKRQKSKTAVMGCCDCLCDVMMHSSLQVLHYSQSVRCGRASTCTFRAVDRRHKEEAHCDVKLMPRLQSPFNQNRDNYLFPLLFVCSVILTASQTTHLYQMKKPCLVDE